jgi:hypothetical protein
MNADSSASSVPTEDGTWTTGDFVLVSADNVLFRVESYFLYAARFVPPTVFPFTIS